MLKVYDKAQWHIDAGLSAEAIVEKMKILLTFLNNKGMLGIEGKEMIDVGIDSSVSIHERMLTETGKSFMNKYYDNVINLSADKIEDALDEAHKKFIS